MIKAKDPRIVRIDVAIPRFLIGPPPKETLEVKLISKQVAEIIQAEEEVIPFDKEPKKPV